MACHLSCGYRSSVMHYCDTSTKGNATPPQARLYWTIENSYKMEHGSLTIFLYFVFIYILLLIYGDLRLNFPNVILKWFWKREIQNNVALESKISTQALRNSWDRCSSTPQHSACIKMSTIERRNQKIMISERFSTDVSVAIILCVE